MTVHALRDQPAADLKITQVSDNEFRVTDLTSGKEQTHKISNYNFVYNSLIDISVDGQATKLQFA